MENEQQQSYKEHKNFCSVSSIKTVKKLSSEDWSRVPWQVNCILDAF